MANVLIVEDTEEFVRLTQRALVLGGHEVSVARDGRSALAMIDESPPDVIVLDRLLPDIPGTEIARRVRALEQATGGYTMILMLTAMGAVPDRLRGYDSGVDDYFTKPFSPEELNARVAALVRRNAKPSATVDAPPRREELTYADLRIDVSGRRVWRGERPVALTAREFDLLVLFVRNVDRVQRHELLGDRLWGENYHHGSNLLQMTISSLRDALEQDGEPRIIQTVRGVGYVMRAEP